MLSLENLCSLFLNIVGSQAANMSYTCKSLNYEIRLLVASVIVLQTTRCRSLLQPSAGESISHGLRSIKLCCNTYFVSLIAKLCLQSNPHKQMAEVVAVLTKGENFFTQPYQCLFSRFFISSLNWTGGGEERNGAVETEPLSPDLKRLMQNMPLSKRNWNGVQFNFIKQKK